MKRSEFEVKYSWLQIHIASAIWRMNFTHPAKKTALCRFVGVSMDYYWWALLV